MARAAQDEINKVSMRNIELNWIEVDWIFCLLPTRQRTMGKLKFPLRHLYVVALILWLPLCHSPRHSSARFMQRHFFLRYGSLVEQFR